MLYRKTGYALIRMERSSSIYGFVGDIQSQIIVLPADDNVLDDSIEVFVQQLANIALIYLGLKLNTDSNVDHPK
ncbi:hypothetical protein GT037_003874 [Alternaria burnsii]|uniref:Uncharacterized protein n=1 Tax=Alternaria burnsii TaxID=1187904 RepID=A0A8H7B8G0_9PLEO|nr:uncharacterized protein GT037_003874 [Alternaria burnsii]KAF7678493.1 hypothetical protein GT037_003874 [Alternaria burnsii]